METSSRMRPCLKRNYIGTDHLGAAANYEDQTLMKKNEETVISPSSAPVLAAEAISMEVVNEDDEQPETDENGRDYESEKGKEDESRLSGATEQILKTSEESSESQLAGDQNLVQSSSAVAPGYVLSEHDERIVLELPSSMVRPLRVIRGTFQVSFPGCVMKSLTLSA